MKTVISNGKVITPFRVIKKGSVVIENGSIVDIALTMVQGKIVFEQDR